MRANAVVAARYTCRLAVELSGGGGDEGVSAVVMESESALSGEAPDYGLFVGAHQVSLSGEALVLGIRIDEPRPNAAADKNFMNKSR